MKKRLMSLVLTAAMLLSMTPAVQAAQTTGGGPDDFQVEVGLSLMPARSSGLYDDPDEPLPQVRSDGFIREVEGWTPSKVTSGVPVPVSEADGEAMVIEDADQLQSMTKGSYVLGADIDLSEVAWTPIKTNGSVVLDGQGHTIKGLNLDMTGVDGHGGLFGEVGGDLTVKNLALENCAMTTDATWTSSKGVLAGDVRGTVQLENVSGIKLSVLLDGNKTGNVGGLIGYVEKSAVVRDVSVESTVLRSEDKQGTPIELGYNARMGGLIGSVSGGVDIRRCYVKTKLDTTDANCATGGMLGSVGAPERIFADCKVEADITARNTCGGLVGLNTNGYWGEKYFRMENCVVLGNLGARNRVGGYFGDVNGNNVEFNACRYRGTITLNEGSTLNGSTIAGAGGFVGNCEYATITAENCACDVIWKADCADVTAPGVKAGVGGILGFGNGGCELYVNGCNLKLTASKQNVNGLYAGGVCGKHYASGGKADVRDTFAEVDLSCSTSKEYVYAAGMIAWIGKASFVNCGADVDISVTMGENSGAGAAGLCWETDTFADMAKCYANGEISITGGGKSRAWVAGLADVGQASQCYSGVDITVNSYEAAAAGLINDNQGKNIISSWSDADLRITTQTDSRVGGLIGWNSNGPITDCCFTGSITTNMGGNLGGIAATGTGTIRNCYVRTDFANGSSIGGIMGGDYVAGVTNIYDCRFEGSIRNATKYAAGILAYGNGGTIARCKVDAAIDCPDISVGGVIAGDYGMSTVRDCAVAGSVKGRLVGGIAGDCYYLSIYDCTVSAQVDIAVTYGISHGENFVKPRGAGGIAYASYVVKNCHMLTRMNIRDENGVPEVGGILATVVYPYPGTAIVSGCTSKGVICHGQGNTSVGGICGDDSFIIADCRVDGDVLVSVEGGSGRVGGICGGTSEQIYNCVVNGDVSIRVMADEEDTGAVCAGGIAGHMASNEDSTLSNSYHMGRVNASASGSKHIAIYTEHPLVGMGGKIDNSSFVFDTEREEQVCFIRTYWHEEDDTIMRPLGGVSISVGDNIVGTTNDNGVLELSSQMLKGTGRILVFAEKEGYFGAEKDAWLADNGVLNLYLKKKTPGKIYLKSARVYDKEGDSVELLYTHNSYSVSWLEQEPTKMYFGVDWNDTQEDGRVLQLVSADGESVEELSPNDYNYVNLNDKFIVEDDFYLKATALTADGELSETKTKLDLSIYRKVPSVFVETEEVPLGDTEKWEGLDFLSGVNANLSFGDLNSLAAKVELKNKVLTIEFATGDERKPVYISKNFFGGQSAVSVGGKLAIPVTSDGKWSGSFFAQGEMDPVFEVLRTVYWQIPVGITSKFSGKVNASIGLEEGVEYPQFFGSMGGEVTVDMMAGPGVANSVVTLLIGPQLGATGEVGLTVKPMDDEVPAELIMKILGSLDLAFKAKGGEIDWGAGYQLGAFSWDNIEGAKFYALGGEVHPGVRAMAVSGWTASSRDIAEDSGFVGAVPAMFARRTAAAAMSAQLYANIMKDSYNALTLEDGVATLYFTADDQVGTDGTVPQHTAVWCTQQDGDGIWSEPVMISPASNGYPDQLHADGGFAVWVEATETESLEGMLTSGRIRVVRNGEESFVSEKLGYVFDARVSAAPDGSGALVTWMEDNSVNGVTTFTAENATLRYARYNASTSEWTTGKVGTGENIPVEAAPDYAGDKIYWVDLAGNSYISYGGSFTYTQKKLSELEPITSVQRGEYTASMTADGTLTVWKGDKKQAELETHGSDASQLAMLGSEAEGWFVLWNEGGSVCYADSASNWSYAKPIVSETVQVTGLSAVLVDGRPVISYYIPVERGEDDFALNLMSAKAPDYSGIDLSVGELSMNTTDMVKARVLRLDAEVTNLREEKVTAFAYTVTDETGAQVASGRVDNVALGYGDSERCYAVFVPDTSAVHTYTLSVAVEGDADETNNSGDISTESRAVLVSTGFAAMPDGRVGLEAVVTNSGAAPMESMTVEVFRAAADGTGVGEALVTETFENLATGFFRQVILEESETHQLYKVVLSAGGEELDSEMLMWEDEDAVGVWLSGVKLTSNGTGTANLRAQNWTQDLQLVISVSEADTGRTVAVSMDELSAWEGSREVELDFADKLDSGSYTYTAFLLKADTLAPVTQTCSDTVYISG